MKLAGFWAAIALIVGGLAVAAALKLPCEHHGFDRNRYLPHCYSDIEPLYSVRGFGEGKVPYRDQPLEYPVLTGTLLWALAGLSDTGESFFWLNVGALGLLAVAGTLLLASRVDARRLAFWAAGSPIILYAFVNWDLLAAVGGLAGILAYLSGRNGSSGVALGLGASAKLFPALLVPVFVADRVRRGEWRQAARLTAAFVGAAALVNLPWIVLAPRGWLDIWRFHAFRFPEFETFWYWVFHLGRKVAPGLGWNAYVEVVPTAALLLFGAGLIFIVTGALRGGSPLEWGVAATLLFFVTSHVYSPQYAVWIVPLLLLARVPWPLLWSFAAADLAVFLLRFRYFEDFQEPAGELWLYAYEFASFLRMLVLILVLVGVMKKAREQAEPPEARADTLPAAEASA